MNFRVLASRSKCRKHHTHVSLSAIYRDRHSFKEITSLRNGGTTCWTRAFSFSFSASRGCVAGNCLNAAVAHDGTLLPPRVGRWQRSLQPREPWNKRVAEGLCLNKLHNHESLDFGLPTFGDRPLGGSKGSSFPGAFASSEDELRVLCKAGLLDRAMGVLLRMDQQGTIPSATSYRSLLKACAERKALNYTKKVHAHLVEHGLECSTSLCEFVVSTLVKCADLEFALQVFHRLPHRTISSWTAMISGYTAAGQNQKALRMFDWMKEEGVEPNAYTMVSLLKACGSLGDLEKGKRIHEEALKYRCVTDVFVHSCLVDMYGRCGSIVDAQNAFDGLSQHDVVAWTALLAAYTRQAQAEKALHLYEQMQEEGVSPDGRTFVVALQACGIVAEEEEGVLVDGRFIKIRSFRKGKEVHASARRKGLDCGAYVGSALVGMYGKCGSAVDARNVFEAVSGRNVVCWTVMLAVYVGGGQAAEALKLYNLMQEEGISPDIWTSLSAIQACGKLAEMAQGIAAERARPTVSADAHKGKALHARAWVKGYDTDVVVGSALASMYSKCGTILDAQLVFDGLPRRDVVAWTAMIIAYVEHGEAGEALNLFQQLQEEGVSPNNWTIVSALQACCSLADCEEGEMVDGKFLKLRSLWKGKAIHAAACRRRYDSDVFVANTLVIMYGKCGVMVDAESIFNRLPRRNVVSWTAMLAIYVQQGCTLEALQLYEEMKAGGSTPDEATHVWVLHACSKLGSLPMVRHIHGTLVCGRNGLSHVLAATLITAYGRCGSMLDAQRVFSEVGTPNVILWTALIAAYAWQGNCVASLQCYEEMRLAGVKPDEVTFLSLLSACSHAGLVDEGVAYFESMTRDYDLTPEIGHFVSMVDLLGRAGCFSRITDLLSAMPMQPSLAMWLCLLGACRKHGKVVLAEQAFDCAIRLQPNHSAAFVLMSNIYSDVGLFDHAKKVRRVHEDVVVKEPGQSRIEHEQVIHTFMVQDNKHPQHRQVLDLLKKACSGRPWVAM